MSDYTQLSELIAAAEKGDPDAQNQLGAFLATGSSSTIPNPKGGLFWYVQAVKQGHVQAMWNAGSMLIDGEEGIEKDEPVGMMLIEKAANCGDSSACLFLSECFSDGTYGVKKNNQMCESWKAKAWDCENQVTMTDPVDLERKHGICVEKPKL